MEVTAFKDWREDFEQSSGSLSLTSDNLFAAMKNRTNRCSVMSYRLDHAVLYKSPRIQAIEVEIAAPFSPKVTKWSTPSGQ
jgi:hypothetical protein